MLKYSSDENGVDLEVEGSTADILAEIGTMVKFIHVRLSKNNLIAGIEFTHIIKDKKFWDYVLQPSDADYAIAKYEADEDV